MPTTRCPRCEALIRTEGPMTATSTFAGTTHTHARCPVLLFRQGGGPMPVDGLDGRDDLGLGGGP